MHKFVFFDRGIVNDCDARINAISSSAIYGKGIFTTIAICDGETFLWDKHWRRLHDNAGRLGIDISDHDEETVKVSLSELIETNGARDTRARITFFDESSSRIWPVETKRKTSLLITTGDRRPVSDTFRITISPCGINTSSPLAGIKSCNYLGKILALDEAKRRGFDEAIQLNQRGEITSGCMSNVFWLKNEKLYTPGLATGCLPGTTREFVLENFECSEVKAGIGVLQNAESIFLTSAGISVVQIAEFDGKKMRGERHEIERLLARIAL